MRARQLNRKVQIWQTRKVEDGFGGSKTYNELITSSWAAVRTHKDTSRDTEVGVGDYSEKLDITMRYRNDIQYNSVTQFLTYRGVKYTFTMSPMNQDFNEAFIVLTASRQKTKSVEVLEPINPDANTIFINYKNRVIGEGGTFEADDCVLTYIENNIA